MIVISWYILAIKSLCRYLKLWIVHVVGQLYCSRLREKQGTITNIKNLKKSWDTHKRSTLEFCSLPFNYVNVIEIRGV